MLRNPPSGAAFSSLPGSGSSPTSREFPQRRLLVNGCRQSAESNAEPSGTATLQSLKEQKRLRLITVTRFLLLLLPWTSFFQLTGGDAEPVATALPRLPSVSNKGT